MAEMEDKINSILSDPKMMQQIMTMAQSLGGKEQPVSQEPGLDPGIMKQLAGLAGQGSIDKQQQSLLRALEPYLSTARIRKLERAMRAAKMAHMASAVLGSGKIFAGR